MKHKKLLSVILAFIIIPIVGCGIAAAVQLIPPKAPETESVLFANDLGCGWNLGNTLEAWEIPEPDDTETCWGNPKATNDLFVLLKELGFSSVRIPVTWFQHVDEEYNIEKEWMDRVNEVVDLALENDFFAIINIQHDDQDWLIADYEHEKKATKILRKMWTQIADRFSDYDERLVFDVMNEPRVVGAEDEWTGSAETRDVVNRFNIAALSAIRESGGKNEKRYVMIPTCCAHLEKEDTDALVVPDDSRVIVSLHYYYGTAHRSEFLDCENDLTVSDKLEVRKTLRRVFKTFVKNGVGVSISEFGWTDREHLENLSEKAEWFVGLVRAHSMSALVWDNGGDFRLIDRNELKAEFPSYVDAAAGRFD